MQYINILKDVENMKNLQKTFVAFNSVFCFIFLFINLGGRIFVLSASFDVVHHTYPVTIALVHFVIGEQRG